MAKKKPPPETKVEFTRHKDKRKNIPTEELRDFIADDEAAPRTMLYPRDPSLDPQLVWKGKDDQDRQDLAVPIVPVYIQEKIHPQAIIDDLLAQRKKGKPEEQLTLFADFNGIDDFDKKIDFYHHDQHWSNRMILGDSLLVRDTRGIPDTQDSTGFHTDSRHPCFCHGSPHPFISPRMFRGYQTPRIPQDSTGFQTPRHPDTQIPDTHASVMVLRTHSFPLARSAQNHGLWSFQTRRRQVPVAWQKVGVLHPATTPNCRARRSSSPISVPSISMCARASSVPSSTSVPKEARTIRRHARAQVFFFSWR